mmetsp:Transcript_26563/g.61835  ORF Transcript_26563/g.61835 Transcript_26563/m.61835 type:complete len:426 (+) Transcript_26563:44-1321(+)
MMPVSWTVLLLSWGCVAQYPTAVQEEVWCQVPNYRYYRWTATKARGYPASDSFTCSETLKPDDCFCLDYTECFSGYCIPDQLGATYCTFPIFQLAEIEFWRHGQAIPTRKKVDAQYDAYRIVNAMDVPQTWGIWELEFYSNTNCSTLLTGGVAIASSSLARGFGHSVDHTAPLGSQDTPRTYWQSSPFADPTDFNLHGPAPYAFDGNTTTNWWADCRNPCGAGTQWLGLNFSAPTPVKCVRILQDKDQDYASFSLALEGHNAGNWSRITTFNAGTRAYGGVWEELSVPQGVAFVSSVSHARALDGNLNSSVVELTNTQLEFDFGVETEIDAYRWATACEPGDRNFGLHDGRTCDYDGLCPRDPVQWTLQGSVNRSTWVTLHSQATDYLTTIYRKSFVSLLPVHHRVYLTVDDIWPDGRGQCAARR